MPTFGRVTETEQICLEIVCNIDRAENNEQVQVFVRNRKKKREISTKDNDPWLVWIHTVAKDAIQEVAQRKIKILSFLKPSCSSKPHMTFYLPLDLKEVTPNVHAALFHRLNTVTCGFQAFKRTKTL